MGNRSKFYCWLIGKLQRRRMTLQEICDEWAVSSSNRKEAKLSVRTFHRYRGEIFSIFGLDIECDKASGYRYFIRRDKYVNTEITDWLLSSLRIASLSDRLKYHEGVMLEAAPQNTEYLDDILGAIDKHYAIKFHYRTAYGKECDMEIVPAFIRLFHQRWYVIGTRTEDEAPRVLPFDRISYIEVVCKKQVLSKKAKVLMRPENFYDGCFGVIRQEDVPPEPIRIRAFYPENNYIEEVPLHASQRIVSVADDDSYADYELMVSPTREFIQELLWHGRKIIVLSPDRLRQEMIGILRDMTDSYETGRNTVEE